MKRLTAIDGSTGMDIASALQIVIDLAKSGAQAHATTIEQERENNEAIAIVEDLAVNEYGDD